MRTFDWAIEDILESHEGLYLDHCAAMVVAVLSRLTSPPCEFLVHCEGFSLPDLRDADVFLARIGWGTEMARAAKRIRRAEQRKPIVERAAVGIAALLFAQLIPEGRLRVTRHGDRADFWLTESRCALEISGTENRYEILQKLREKTAQMLANRRRWPGYIFVCCFEALHCQVHWSYHHR